MSRRRWSLLLGPPGVLLAAALVATRLQPGAGADGGSTVPPGACAASPLAVTADGKPAADKGLGSWWRMVDRVDASGALTGRQLTVGRGDATSSVADLLVASAVSGPVAGVVVVTVDDGRIGEVLLVSTTTGCSWSVHRTTDVVRGAILDLADGTVLAHLVSRATRDDLGTWRIGAADAVAKPVLVAPVLPAGLLDGATFATDLRLDAAGRRLAVQSCGDTNCVTRLFDLAAPARAPVALRGSQGALVGFTGRGVVTWSECFGFPCPLLTWDVAAGTADTLVELAEAAAVTPDGSYLLATIDSARGQVLRVDLATGARALVRGLAQGELPLAAGALATGGVQLATDEVAVGATGAIPRPFRPSAAEVIP